MCDQQYVFARLYRAFQRGHAKYGRKVFFLSGHTDQELELEKLPVENVAELMCFLPISGRDPDPVHGYWVYAPVKRNQFGKYTSICREPFDLFNRLAAEAGAALPLAVRKGLPVEPADPVSTFLSFLWQQKSPEDQASAVERAPDENRILSAQPFLEAADAIEQGGLLAIRAQAGPSPGGLPHGHAIATPATSPPTNPLPNNPIPEGEWLLPASLADIANRLENMTGEKAKVTLAPYGLKKLGRQTWTVRLDRMPRNIRERLEKQKGH